VEARIVVAPHSTKVERNIHRKVERRIANKDMARNLLHSMPVYMDSHHHTTFPMQTNKLAVMLQRLQQLRRRRSIRNKSLLLQRPLVSTLDIRMDHSVMINLV
jgi:hypothetical protein